MGKRIKRRRRKKRERERKREKKEREREGGRKREREREREREGGRKRERERAGSGWDHFWMETGLLLSGLAVHKRDLIAAVNQVAVRTRPQRLKAENKVKKCWILRANFIYLTIFLIFQIWHSD